MATTKTTKTKRVSYSEPVGYFPKSVRKANKLGEFAEESKTTKKTKKK